MVAAASGHHNPYQNYFNGHIDVSAAVAANELYSAYLSTANHQQQQSAIPPYNNNNTTMASRLLTPVLNQSLKSESIDLLNHRQHSSFEIVQNSNSTPGCGSSSNGSPNSKHILTTKPSSVNTTNLDLSSSQIYPWMKRLHSGNESGKLKFLISALLQSRI
jgi:hypothetical protein